MLVLGGSGFVGRHAVAAPAASRARMVVGTRDPDRMSGHMPALAREVPRRRTWLEELTESSLWGPLIGDVDAVLNCVGILRQSGSSTHP